MSDVKQWKHDEQRALENEIISLREQVEKLTKERDFWRDGCQKEKLSAIDWAGKHQAQMLDHKQQLAALAEQNEKMRKALKLARFDSLNMTLTDWDILKSVANLPNLSTPVLNKYRAEGMREAINLYSPDDSAQDWIEKISARADELEKGEPA